MMRTIDVIPNPYIALDANGIPQGVVGAGAPGAFVGAQIDLLASQRTGKVRLYYPPNRDGSLTRKVFFTSDMVTAIMAGELLVTKLADALACGLTEKEFLPPLEALEAEKAKALAYLQSVKGKDAKVGEIPRTMTVKKEDDGETAPIEKPSVQLTPSVKMSKEA